MGDPLSQESPLLLGTSSQEQSRQVSLQEHFHPPGSPLGTIPQGKVRRKKKKSKVGMAVMGNIPPESSGLQWPQGKWWKPHRLLHPQLDGLTLRRPGLTHTG